MSEQKTDQDKAYVGLISQQEAQYVPLSAVSGQACANCRWFKEWGNYCHLVEDYPQPILATGWSNRWEALPQPIVLEVEPIPVILVDSPVPVQIQIEEMALEVPKNLVKRAKEFLQTLVKSTAPTEPPPQPAFAVFKAANGKKAWIARYTGKWIDREGEIIADAAQDAYVARVQSGKVSPPELWMWHNKATKHGQAVTVWRSGGFTLAAGYFDDTPAGNKAFDYYQQNQGKIKLSHMFHYPVQTKIGGVYHELNTIEVTTLPDGAEAFPYTSFQEIQAMTLPDVAQTMIRDALGEDTLTAALAADKQAVADGQKLDAAGIASKNLDQYPGSKLLEAAEKVAAAETKLAETETRLKAAEDALKAIVELPALVKSLQESVNQLTGQVKAAQEGEATALEKLNGVETRLAELTDLKPPASKSDDTLLGDREKSLIERAMEDAKSVDQLSLVEKLVVESTTVSS